MFNVRFGDDFYMKRLSSCLTLAFPSYFRPNFFPRGVGADPPNFLQYLKNGCEFLHAVFCVGNLKTFVIRPYAKLYGGATYNIRKIVEHV